MRLNKKDKERIKKILNLEIAKPVNHFWEGMYRKSCESYLEDIDNLNDDPNTINNMIALCQRYKEFEIAGKLR